MHKLKRNICICMALGFVAFVSLVFSHLALKDIAHGEPDLKLEWNMLRAAALVILTFITFSVFTFRHVLKRLPD